MLLERIGPVLLRTSHRTKTGEYLLMSQGDPPCSSLLSHSLPVCLPSDQHQLNARWNKRSAWSEGVAKNAKRQGVEHLAHVHCPRAPAALGRPGNRGTAQETLEAG